VPVPATDLHALATGLLDDARVDLLLRACLALDWRNVRHAWSASSPVTPVPTLGLLQPLAHGLPLHQTVKEPAPRQAAQVPAARQGDGNVPRLALSPDWANRLIAGQVAAVHHEAAARLRQTGWLAVPALPKPAADGISIAAALVPRCRGALDLMGRHFAIRIADEPATTTSIPPSAGSPESLPTETPELTQELS
jgi:hypothetical protein